MCARARRNFKLVAAKVIPSTYCSRVYSKQLIGDLGSKEAVLAVMRDYRTAGLSAQDVALLAYARENRAMHRRLRKLISPLCALRLQDVRSPTSPYAPHSAASSAASLMRWGRGGRQASSTATRRSATR